MFKQAKWDEKLIFEYRDKKLGCRFGEKLAEKEAQVLPKKLQRTKAPRIPNLSEGEVVRHFTRLSQMSYGVDLGIYPLGSCTMKYTPKLLEQLCRDSRLNLHPYASEKLSQGNLQMLWELEQMLCEIGGVEAVTLQPAAGAHGEFLGMLLTKKYHADKTKNEIIVPDTAHGTNPASAKMGGFEVIEIPSTNGRVDLDVLEDILSERTAALMLTSPNTLGIFEDEIVEIAKRVHEQGALLYYDGANLNSMLGIARPGDMGFDIVHFNLHKTFGAPHGGGGPGSGPIGVTKELERFLPIPRIEKVGNEYKLNYDKPNSVGKLRSWYGNFSVLVKAWVWIKLMGAEGLREVAEIATLNSNYIKERLKRYYKLPYKGLRKHEFVVAPREKRTLQIAKELLDQGMHPPTIYFPLIVEEAMMIEPTESEAKEVLDEYIDMLRDLAEKKVEGEAPTRTSVGRVDEVKASRKPIVTWAMMCDK